MSGDTTLPARLLARVAAVLAFAIAAACAILTAGDAAAQEPPRATIIYSATPTAVVSIRGGGTLVFVANTVTGTVAMTATVIGISGTVDADGSNFQPLPEGATGTVMFTVDIYDRCNISQGCYGHLGLEEDQTPAQRLATIQAANTATLGMYRNVGANLDEVVDGDVLIYHLVTAANSPAPNVQIQWLADVGVNLDFRVGEGISPLHRAARNIDVDAMLLLATIGANTTLKTTDARESTPLLDLVREGLEGTPNTSVTAALNLLTSTGTFARWGLDITDADGKSALDIAAERSQALPNNAVAATAYAILAEQGALCIARVSELCPGNVVGFNPNFPINYVFIVRDSEDPVRRNPGLIGKVENLDRQGNVVVGVLSYPETNGKLNLKLKTAIIILPKNPPNFPPIN